MRQSPHRTAPYSSANWSTSPGISRSHWYSHSPSTLLTVRIRKPSPIDSPASTIHAANALGHSMYWVPAVVPTCKKSPNCGNSPSGVSSSAPTSSSVSNLYARAALYLARSISWVSVLALSCIFMVRLSFRVSGRSAVLSLASTAACSTAKQGLSPR